MFAKNIEDYIGRLWIKANVELCQIGLVETSKTIGATHDRNVGEAVFYLIVIQVRQCQVSQRPNTYNTNVSFIFDGRFSYKFISLLFLNQLVINFKLFQIFRLHLTKSILSKVANTFEVSRQSKVSSFVNRVFRLTNRLTNKHIFLYIFDCDIAACTYDTQQSFPLFFYQVVKQKNSLTIIAPTVSINYHIVKFIYVEGVVPLLQIHIINDNFIQFIILQILNVYFNNI